MHGTHVTAYEIAGLGFTPSEVWLDDDLQFFGSVSSYQSILREGFEGDIQPLIAAQDARAAERTSADSRRPHVRRRRTTQKLPMPMAI